MSAIVGMPDRVRSMRTVSTSRSFASIGASARSSRLPFSRSSAGSVATRRRSLSEVWLIRRGILPPLPGGSRSGSVVRML